MTFCGCSSLQCQYPLGVVDSIHHITSHTSEHPVNGTARGLPFRATQRQILFTHLMTRRTLCQFAHCKFRPRNEVVHLRGVSRLHQARLPGSCRIGTQSLASGVSDAVCNCKCQSRKGSGWASQLSSGRLRQFKEIQSKFRLPQKNADNSHPQASAKATNMHSTH